MDDALRQRHQRAAERIAAERERRGVSSAIARPRSPREALDRCGTLAETVSAIEWDALKPKIVQSDAARETELAAEAEAQRERDRRAFEARIRSLRLPVTAADEQRLIAGTLAETSCVAVVRKWLGTERPWLVLSGPVGRGKTLAAAEACAQRRGSRYIGARELERIFTARYGDEVDQQRALIECRGVLVVDDIGRERDAEGMAAALLDLVDARRTNGCKSVAITNVDVRAFNARYADERLLSRLAECAAWVSDKGEDMRRRR